MHRRRPTRYLSSLTLLATLTGCTDSTKPAGGGLELLWRSPVAIVGQDWVDGTPAVDGGRVFVQEGHSLVAIDAASGARLWSRRIRIAASPPPTTLLANAGVVYVSETDSLMAVEASTGRTIWSVHPDSQAVTEPALDNSGFYTGQRGLAVVYALERATGAIRWKTNVVVGSAFAAHVRGVAVVGDTVYAAVEKYLDRNGVAAKGVLVALDRMTGTELWRYETSDSKDFFYNAPLVVGSQVIVNNFYRANLISIDARTALVQWSTDVGATVRAVVIGDRVLAAGSDTKARALDLRTGVVKWTGSTGSSSFGVGACRGNLFVSAFDLRRFDGATGALTGNADRGVYGGFISHIASDGTRAFAVSSNGVFAFAC